MTTGIAGRTLAFVGTLNRPMPYVAAANGPGLAVMTFDEATGALAPLHETGFIDNPSYLTVDAAGRTLYAVSEVFGWHEGTVTAYRIDPATGALTYINKQPTRGSIAAWAGCDASGRWLLVANYRMGEDGARAPQAAIVYPIEPDGGLGAPVSSVGHTGSGPDPARQEGPHPHIALPSPDNRFVLVADLGLDRIVVYAFDAASGRLTLSSSVPMQPGSGPRHLVFHPSGRLVFASDELSSTLTALRWDAAEGRLTRLHTVSALPEGWTGESHCSDIGISPDGRFLYAANRGHDSISVHAIDPDTGHLTPRGHQSTQGRTPRQFTLDASGRWLLVAVQNADAVVVLARDAQTGALSDSGMRAAIGTPMCVKLHRMG